MIKVTVFVLLCSIVLVQCTDRPIIGVLAQEMFHSSQPKYGSATSYIVASYVKAVEAAGARVVPIFIKKSYSYYSNLLHSINGVFAPGGGTILQPGHGYYDALAYIVEITKEMNDKGIFFPIFGICQGFEALLTIANNHTDIQTKCDVLNEKLPITFKPDYHSSFQYSRLPKEVFLYLTYFRGAKNNHEWCTTPSNFSKSLLPNEWKVTATINDRRGLKFIASAEHKKYPILAMQYHASEKQYEWIVNQKNPHSYVAIKACRYFFDVFVDLARLNDNKFTSKSKECKTLIYNYVPINSYKWNDFDQVYLFE